MNVFARPAPRWFNIEAGRPFLLELARGLTASLAAEGPDALAEALVLVPTRRAARGLAEAFLAASGAGAVLLPQVRALGDLEVGEPPFEPGDAVLDLPPAISPARRRYELARLAADRADRLGRRLDAAGALALGDALGGLLQSAQIEEVDPAGRIGALAPEALAEHWRLSSEFLEWALAEWPLRLAALGMMDADARRVALLRRLAFRWRADPPAYPVIAAGSTGSAPAVADLLTAAGECPRGCVVLPGLDLGLAQSAWESITDEHPQAGMKRLLENAWLEREEIAAWPGGVSSGPSRWRRRLVNEALRPADATADWLQQISALRAEGSREGIDPIAEGLDGLTSVTARNEEEASACAALILREALETPGRTAALVTPDAALARRVSAWLTRWRVVADSSAGRPLASFPVGTLMALASRAALDPLDPVVLLGLAKHRLARLGLEDWPLAQGRRALELALRGPRRAAWEEIEVREPGRDLLKRLREIAEGLAAPFSGGRRPGAAEAATVLARGMESLAVGAWGGLGELWAGPAGEAAGGLVTGLLEDAGGLPPLDAAGFVGLIDRLLAGEVVRGGGAAHPRLKILGAMEARLVDADLLVLAGLEEGVWPQAAPTDPFLSRPMRETLKLPPPERRVGLAAHDFAQGACAPEVTLITTERREGAPAVASRWLWRLQTLVRGAGLALPGREDILCIARTIDAPARFAPSPRPCPKPPLAARPRELPVTGVERWVRDPYSIYARYVLRLKPLDRPGEPVEALARGTAVHAAFERFAREHPGPLGEAAADAFAQILLECLVEAGVPRPRLAREHALARNVAPWVIAFEERRRPGARLLVEQRGEYVFEAAGGPFKITARADRIELRCGRGDVLDFKTGSPPSQAQVDCGLAPQLTLTAAILAAGGFVEAGPTPPGQLVYVRVSGGRTPGKIELRGAPPASEALAARALAGLKRRVDAFDDAETGYASWATPQFQGRYGGDYDHLARLWEWGVIGADDEEGGPP